MFVRLTNLKGKQFMLNMNYIQEIVEDEKNVDTNTILISIVRNEKSEEKIFEVQETIEEINMKMEENKK